MINFERLTGKQDEFSLKERVFHTTSLLGCISAAFAYVTHPAKLEIGGFIYGFLVLSLFSGMAFIVSKFFNKKNMAYILLIMGQSVFIFLEWMWQEGLSGTSGLTFLLVLVFSLHLFPRQKHNIVYTILLSLLAILSFFETYFPSIIQPNEVAEETRSHQFLFIAGTIGFLLFIFKKEEEDSKVELTRQKLSYKQLIESIKDDYLLATINKDGELSYLSPSPLALYEIADPEYGYRPFFSLLARISKKLAKYENIKLKEEKFTLKSGEEIYLQIHFYENVNEPTSRNLIIHEVTSQAQLHKQLKKSVEKERELNKIRNEFISMVSHQFRTPLTTISSASELLKLNLNRIELSTSMEFSINKKFEQLGESIEHLTQMMQGLLLFSEIHDKQDDLTFQPTDICALVNKVIKLETYKHQQYREVELRIEGNPIDAHVNTDQFEQMLQHLLNNALNFSAQSTQNTPLIHLTFKKDFYSIDIIDFGIGISEENLLQVGTPFFRAKDVENSKGLGLGLVLAKSVIQMHKGIININSTYGKRTQVHLEFPYTPHQNELSKSLDLSENSNALS